MGLPLAAGIGLAKGLFELFGNKKKRQQEFEQNKAMWDAQQQMSRDPMQEVRNAIRLAMFRSAGLDHLIPGMTRDRLENPFVASFPGGEKFKAPGFGADFMNTILGGLGALPGRGSGGGGGGGGGMGFSSRGATQSGLYDDEGIYGGF